MIPSMISYFKQYSLVTMTAPVKGAVMSYQGRQVEVTSATPATQLATLKDAATKKPIMVSDGKALLKVPFSELS